MRFQRLLARACLSFLVLLSTSLSLAADPTEAEVNAEYTRWVNSVGRYEYRTSHILLATQAQARSALDEIKAGASFATVAKKLSQDPGSKDKGGDLGWVLRNTMVAPFATAMQTLNPSGLYPEPVQTAFGWHLLWVEQVRSFTPPRYEDVRASVEAELKKRSNPAQAASPTARLPQWTTEQWDALLGAAQHTTDGQSYAYKAMVGASMTNAKLASNLGMPKNAGTFNARNLIDVPPYLRFALARLYVAGARSAPISVTNTQGSTTWAVVELVSRGKSTPLQPNTQFQTDAAAWVAKGFLPPPELLLGSKEEQAFAAYRNATTAQAIEQIPTHLTANIEYGNHSSPLLNAIVVRNDMEAAKALVKRGADVNRCGVWGCPIAAIAKIATEAQSLTWTQWLLQNGAKPDQVDPRGADIYSTALTAASSNGYISVAKLLVEAGASLDGIAGAKDTPIEAAAVSGHRPMVEWLIARGASVLPQLDRSLSSFGQGTLYTAALATNNESFIQWAEQTMLAAAFKTGKQSFKVSFEQEGTIQSIDNGIVKLKAAPFNLVFEFPIDDGGIQMAGSTDAKWLDELRGQDRRNAMFRPFASGAMSEVPSPDSYDLFVMRPCAVSVKPDDGCEGTHMFLNTDPKERKDFHEKRSNPVRFVRSVRNLFDTSAPGKGIDVPIAKMAGKNLYLAMAIPIYVGGFAGLRLPQTQYITVEFSR